MDFKVRDCGTVVLLRPMSERASEWIDNNIDLEPWQDKFQIAIEPRMFPDIAEGIRSDGMTFNEPDEFSPEAIFD
jgi:hypothetical protein